MEQELQTPQAESALYVIDAMPLLYRGHFVFLKKPRLTTTGINTSALTAFAGSVLQLIETRQPSHIVLVFDSTTPTFRHELYPEYKAQRQKMPEDLAASIPMAKELADALRIPSLRVDGYEADDLMGTLARQAGEAGMTTFLVTPDKDIAQLVTATTFLYRPGKQADAAEIYGRDEVSRRWGVREPGQMIDLLAMAGDSSDNIPGIRGVGEKTAQALLAQYGSLEEVLAHAGELKGKLAEKVAESAEAARMSYQLATIRQDVPLPCTIDDLKAQPPDREALRQVLSKYELLKMGRRLLGDDFTLESQTPDVESIATRPHTYTCVTDEAGLAALADELGRATRWAFDTETTGLDPWNSRLVGVSFATAPGKAWYVPVPVGGKERERVLQWLRPRFDDPRPIRIAHNAKFDLTVLRQHGVPVGGICHDTMLTHYVLDASERHSLDYLARQLLNYDTIPISSLIGDGKGGDGPTMGDLAPGAVSDYACEDADVTLRLYEHLRPEATRAGLLKALEDSEEPLVPVLIEMEAEGVRIDRSVLDEYSKELDRELLQLELSIRELAGGGFNLNSPKQLGEELFDRRTIPMPHAPAPAYATNGAYCRSIGAIRSSRRFSTTAPPTAQIDLRRQAAKCQSRHRACIPLQPGGHRDGSSGLINPNPEHPHPHRARTARRLFVARDDNHVLSGRYSQVELRRRLAEPRQGHVDALPRFDIHAATAAQMYDVEPLFVTGDA